MKDADVIALARAACGDPCPGGINDGHTITTDAELLDFARAVRGQDRLRIATELHSVLSSGILDCLTVKAWGAVLRSVSPDAP